MQTTKDKIKLSKSTVFTENKLNCSGCGACAKICKQSAITMTEDSEGFLFPKLNTNKCIQCGFCDQICPEVNSHQNNPIDQQVCYIATNTDDNYSKNSATIGICTMIAEYILSIGGYVFGVVLDEKEWRAKHVCVTTNDDLQKIRNSKYIQSDTEDTFKQVKVFLETGKLVLYTGTPCQIAGLKAFLRKDYINLYTIDLICHGTYSYKIIRKEIDFWQRKFRGPISNFRFRSKHRFPWSYGGVINFDITQNNTIKHIERHGSCSPAYRCYAYSGDGKNYILRETCYACKFRDRGRYADFTVGDAWGIKKLHSHIFTGRNTRTGISLIFCNTEKANILLSQIKSQLNLIPIKQDQAFIQEALLPAYRSIPKERYMIYQNLDRIEWETLISELFHINFDKIHKQFIRNNYISKHQNRIKIIIKHLLFYNRWNKK